MYSTVESDGNIITYLVMNNDDVILEQLPHKDDGTLYKTEIYLQPGKLPVLKPGPRDEFDLDGFVKEHDLELVSESITGSYISEKHYHTGDHYDIYSHEDYYDDFHHDHYDGFHIHSKESVPIKPGLTERQKKFCSCALKVKNVSNPYAVCAKSTHTSYKNCGEYYDYENMKDEHLISYGKSKGLTIPVPYDRRKMIDTIYEWKKTRY